MHIYTMSPPMCYNRDMTTDPRPTTKDQVDALATDLETTATSLMAEAERLLEVAARVRATFRAQARERAMSRHPAQERA